MVVKVYFYALVALLGSLSIYTDVKEKKIKNLHLFIVILLALAGFIYFLANGMLTISTPLLINPLVALGAGFILYIAGLWQAGDAKLFFTYSLLLPHAIVHEALPLPCIVVFVNTFLLSLIFMIPHIIHTIITHRHAFINIFFAKKTYAFFFSLILITFAIAWILEPLLQRAPFKINALLKIIFIYLGYSLLYRSMLKLRLSFTFFSFVSAGIILRLFIAPESLSLQHIWMFLKNIGTYSLLIYAIVNILQFKKKESARVPLAPFMFVGALLATTQFLIWIIRLLRLRP